MSYNDKTIQSGGKTMLDTKKSIKLCVILTDIFMVFLGLTVIFLPLGVSWYVEKMQRHEDLAQTIMVTCYPCAPFLGFALFRLRRILKNMQCGIINDQKNKHNFYVVCFCCLAISLITLIAGRYYFPFFIVCGTFLFLSLIIYCFGSVITEQ